MIENGDVAMDPIEGSDKGTIERRTAHGLSGRRAAIKKLALGAGAAGAVWAAPAINGTSVVPAVAGAQTTLPPIIEGTPTSGLCAEKGGGGCYSGAGGNDQFQATFGSGGHWNFYFQGCGAGNSESVALAAGPPDIANNYEPPPGYKCKMILYNGNNGAQIYDTGYVSNPIIGFADTGGVIFITLAQFPDGQNKVCVVIQCDPV
ncbi:MAG: hypothetical protein WAX12_04375 [Candidatus Microthrix subdominans]